MPLYRPGNPFGQASETFQQAAATMGKQTKEGPTTEYEAPTPSVGQVFSQGIGLLGTADATWKYGNKAYDWLTGLGAPDSATQAAKAGAGAAQMGQAAQAGQAADAALGSVQLNTGAQAGNISNAAVPGMSQGLEGLTDDIVSDTGKMLDNAGSDVAGRASASWSWGPMVGSTLGGVAGGAGGRALGQAIAGDVGGDVGGILGGAAGGYLGGLAATSLASGITGAAAGAASGAATGATAGSVVPGVGTLVGAGIGALTSFFF